jgi:hypothetical protein
LVSSSPPEVTPSLSSWFPEIRDDQANSKDRTQDTFKGFGFKRDFKEQVSEACILKVRRLSEWKIMSKTFSADKLNPIIHGTKK